MCEVYQKQPCGTLLNLEMQQKSPRAVQSCGGPTPTKGHAASLPTLIMKKLFILAVFGLVSVPLTAFACSCGTGDPRHEFNSARMVFIGRMLSGTEKWETRGENGESIKREAGSVRFAVEEVFKGKESEQVTVEIQSARGTSCGPYGLTRGERYLVYAYGSTEVETTLNTGVCTRTSPVTSKYIKEDLDFLRNLPPAGSGGNVEGRIWADLKQSRTTPLRDVRVKIIGPDEQVITTFTNEEGVFIVKQLKPGKYKVEPEFPPNYRSDHKIAQVNVDDRGTAAVGFETYMEGSVSGRVIDKEGNPFNSIFLMMAGGGKSIYGHSVAGDGDFYVEGAPPGEYVLYVDLEDNKHNRKPYYYPGTYEREKASMIRVGLGEKIEGLEFRLPPEYLVRMIEGEVVWSDGTPAVDVEVLLLCPKSTEEKGFKVHVMPPGTKTDSQGRFRIEGLTGESYWIEARGRVTNKKGESIEMHSPSFKITAEESVKNLKLTLSGKGYFGGCPN